jgi:predicted dehydrogenase
VSDKLKVAVIGVGVGRAHLRGYLACPDAEVVALCDADAARLEAVADEYHIPKRCTDYKELLKMPDLDAVSVALPNFLHAPISIAAMEAGKHVLCEKPLAATLPAGEAMVEASRRTGKLLMITFNYRYRSDAQFIKGLINEKRLGRVYHVRAGWQRRRGIPKAGSWFTRKAQSGGGPLIDLGVHVLDLTMWFLGYPEVVTVSGAMHNALACQGKGASDGASFRPEDYDVEDMALGFLRLRNGSTIALEISWASNGGASDDYFVSLMGDQAGAELYVHNYGRRDTVRLYSDLAGRPVATHPDLPDVIGGHEGAVCEFLTCVRTGAKPTASAENGLTILRLLDALYRSAESGQEIRL